MNNKHPRISICKTKHWCTAFKKRHLVMYSACVSPVGSRVVEAVARETSHGQQVTELDDGRPWLQFGPAVAKKKQNALLPAIVKI